MFTQTHTHKVHRHEADIGVGVLAISAQTYRAVDFTYPLRPTSLKWTMMLAPDRPAYVNFFTIFDPATWVLTFVSMAVVSCLLAAAFLAQGRWEAADAVLIFLTPLSLLAAEV